MSWSCPFHSFQLPLHVPVIFSVCPLHFPCMFRSFVASHFPTSPVVPIGFLVLCFPFIPLHSLCFHFCPFHVPFSSPLFPFHFPLLSCHVDFLFPPLISLHFLAFPVCSPVYPAKKTRIFQRFRKEDVNKHRVFPDFRQKEAGNPNQQRAGRGICDTGSPEDYVHQITARCVGDPPRNPTYQTSGGRRVRGGGYPLSFLRYPTRLRNVGGYFYFSWGAQANGSPEPSVPLFF